MYWLFLAYMICFIYRKEQCKMYYVHYDGMDRRLDEWVGRNRVIARANPNAFTSVLV